MLEPPASDMGGAGMEGTFAAAGALCRLAFVRVSPRRVNAGR